MSSKTSVIMNMLSSKNDTWRTPPCIIEYAERYIICDEFDLDVAASEHNAVCDNYLTRDNDALSHDTKWRGRNVWCNPPYSRRGGGKLAWVNRAIRAVEEGECERVVMLLPASVDCKWFHRALTCGVLDSWHIFEGRLAFLDDEGKAVKGNTIGSVLLVFDEFATNSFTTLPSQKKIEKMFDTA